MLEGLKAQLDDPKTRSKTILFIAVRLHRVEAIVSLLMSTCLIFAAWWHVAWCYWAALLFFVPLLGLYAIDYFWLMPLVKREEKRVEARLLEALEKLQDELEKN